jgi:hypothetical protein
VADNVGGGAKDQIDSDRNPSHNGANTRFAGCERNAEETQQSEINMFQIVDMSWDQGDDQLWAQLERQDHLNRRSAPCEDDCEVRCPFIDVLPEESGKEDGSPLNFGREHGIMPLDPRFIDDQIIQALKLGI